MDWASRDWLVPQSNPLLPKSMFQKGRKNRPEGRGERNKRKVTGVRGSVGVMRGRKHRHRWGMSCHHLSQHPGPPPSGSQDSCGFLKQQDQLPHSPPVFVILHSCLLSTFPRTKLITDNPIAKMQKLRLEAVTHEAQPVPGVVAST